MIHVSLSGGMDSTALLAHILRVRGRDVRCWGFDYGQRHRTELAAAAAIANHYRLPFDVLELPRLSSPALTDGGEVPDGHYAEESMRQTVVQGRNLLFASMLVSRAFPGDAVALAVHAGDHTIYPDCRPTFWDPFERAVQGAYDVEVLTPFLLNTKAHVCGMGARLSAPLHLSWSCYKGGAQHCGRCGTCVERAEAFHLAGVPDPTEYADSDFWKQVV